MFINKIIRKNKMELDNEKLEAIKDFFIKKIII